MQGHGDASTQILHTHKYTHTGIVILLGPPAPRVPRSPIHPRNATDPA